MIGQLRGILAVKKSPYLVVDVNGIGYELQASMTTMYALPMVGKEVFLFTHFVVREDAQLLYAFADESERLVFRQLIRVSGVGPKLALTILSGMNVASFVQCIENRDISRLVKLPGVGKKTAERLVIEMADKLNKDFSTTQQNFSEVIIDNTHDAESALVSLGYKPQEAQAVIRKIYVADADSETLIRLALQSMVK
jgi:Holliday junction DNA helicase RuvA